MTRVITFFIAVALACATAVGSRAQGSPTVFINEFHYDNSREWK